MCILRLRPHSWQPGPAENSSGVCRHAARLFVVALLCLLSPQLGWAQAVLENPQPASFQSGIGLISGWACEATSIEIQFDRRLPVEAASGTDRGDTRGPCGDTDNGFGLPFNWNLLGAGEHTVRALADGVAFASVTVTVTTLGEEFLRGASGEFTLADFPRTGVDVQLRWQEAQQNFVLTDGRPPRGGGTGGSAPAVLENPAPGSFQSGIGIISGWVCEAAGITLQFDSLLPVEAAYGTSREDTRGACGDTDNGFGLLFNWNLLGAGLHTVRALADGVEFASVEVVVTTLGVEFLRGASGEFTLPGFPDAGTEVVVQWQETQQNFVLTKVQLPPKLYWTEGGKSKSIGRANLDGSGRETVVASFEDAHSLALDAAGGKIYWTDNRQIQRANLDGSQLEIVVPPLSAHDIYIALDTAAGKIYWAIYANGGRSVIQRANLDGSGRETVVSKLCCPQSLALDIPRGKLYWADRTHIRRVNLDGSQTEDLVKFGSTESSKTIALTADGSAVFLTEQPGRSNPGQIWRCGTPEFPTGCQLVRSGFQDLRGLAIDDDAGKLYWIDRGGQGRIYRANLDGSQLEILRSGTKALGIVLDVAGDRMYWSEGDKIQRASLDGTESEELVSRESNAAPRGIAVDLAAGTLYWTNERGGVSTATLDGSQQVKISDAGHSPGSIAIDSAGGKVYWTDFGPGQAPGAIYRANTDGTELETFRAGDVSGVTIDEEDDRVYWYTFAGCGPFERNCGGQVDLRRSNLDGSGEEVLIDVRRDGFPVGRVHIDPARQEMYWLGGGTIHKANLDGTLIFPVTGIGSSSHPARAVAFDWAAGLMYWTQGGSDSGSIWRATLDGLDRELVLDGLSSPNDIIVVR